MISNKDWNEYVNTGYASNHMINCIVNSIKNNTELSDKELSIYITYTERIEKKLRSKSILDIFKNLFNKKS